MSNPSGKKSLTVYGVLLLALVVACLVSMLAGAAPFQPMTYGIQAFFGCGWLGPRWVWSPGQDSP